jgi:hypothetical protein
MVYKSNIIGNVTSHHKEVQLQLSLKGGIVPSKTNIVNTLFTVLGHYYEDPDEHYIVDKLCGPMIVPII